MSDTPITDGVDVGITAEVVTAGSYRLMREHARTMERERAALIDALAKLRGERDALGVAWRWASYVFDNKVSLELADRGSYEKLCDSVFHAEVPVKGG